ncbi:sulfatase-like hydrolase/transferase [Dyadobacter sandarakinus]|uniref:sulfatase-like hydrolase/transferase n=1 Tax=Dyadobacter sandarakinus TaxID=2747268 RepID=UPI001E53DB40|nr:sulfatase-like hydrolase/transferase [Dyadobacter sandarakinus]
MQKILITIIALALALTHTAFAQGSRKPNIIFLLTDDHRWDALGAMGNKIIQTPHLDALAKRGILFRNAHVTTAICMVSRASLLSGQYMSRHGINDFDTDFKPDALAQTYPALLKKAGYKIGFIGKFGIGVKNQPDTLFDYWAAKKESQPPYELVNRSADCRAAILEQPPCILPHRPEHRP